jgi:hypothetical protein
VVLRGDLAGLDRGGDTLQDSIEIVENFFIVEAEDLVIVLFEFLGSEGVFCLAIVMDSTIDFDHQFISRTIKVQYKTPHGMLSPPSQTQKLLIPQGRPQQFLGVCHIVPKRSRRFLNVR